MPGLRQGAAFAVGSNPLMVPSRKRPGAFVIALLLGAAALQATAQQPGPSSPVPLTAEVREGRLPNGLRYYIRPNARPQGRAELRLVVNAGSILEDDDQLGAAHFIEHMSFNGTRRFPKNELVSYLQSVGVRLGGDLNANTGYDETIYILPIPVGDRGVLETGLAILREWAGQRPARRRRHQHRARRGARRAAERPGRRRARAPADDAAHVQRQPIRDTDSDRHRAAASRTMTPDALRRFYHDWYRPDLQAVIVVGEVNPDEIERQHQDAVCRSARGRQPASAARALRDPAAHDA